MKRLLTEYTGMRYVAPELGSIMSNSSAGRGVVTARQEMPSCPSRHRHGIGIKYQHGQ